MPKKKTQPPENKYTFDPSIDLDIGNLPKPWTEKQYHFALAYLANGYNATQAAISAGYSEKSAKQHSHNIMTKHDFKHVQDYIAHRQTKVLNKWAFDHDRHIEQLSKMAYFDMKDFAKIDPNTGNFSIDWQKFFDMGYGACVDDIETSTLSIKTVEGGEEILMPVLNSKVKMSKRKDALEMLNKINDLYEKDNTRKLILEGGDKPVEFKTMSMEEAAKAYQESLKDV